MKTLGLKELRSGNFEIVKNLKDANYKFKTQKSFITWYKPQINFSRYAKQKHFKCIVKARYSQIQTYFMASGEVIKFWKNL